MRLISIKEALDEAVTQAREIEQTVEQGGETPGLRCGYEKLDRAMQSIKKGDVVIVAARPGVGKSAFALNVTANNQYGVLIMSLEMTATELSNRLLCMLSKEPLENLQTGHIKSWDRVLAAQTALSSRPIEICDDSTITPASIHECIEEYELRHDKKPDLVIVDYLQLMSLKTGRDITREREVATITRESKTLAKSEKVIVILLSQLKRESENRKKGEDPAPKLCELRESGAIEQDADAVIMLYEDSDSDEVADARLINAYVAKNRNGLRRIIQQICFETTTQRMLESTFMPSKAGKSEPKKKIKSKIATVVLDEEDQDDTLYEDENGEMIPFK